MCCVSSKVFAGDPTWEKRLYHILLPCPRGAETRELSAGWAVSIPQCVLKSQRCVQPWVRWPCPWQSADLKLGAGVTEQVLVWEAYTPS